MDLSRLLVKASFGKTVCGFGRTDCRLGFARRAHGGLPGRNTGTSLSSMATAVRRICEMNTRFDYLVWSSAARVIRKARTNSPI
jgi:hypothetical protein